MWFSGSTLKLSSGVQNLAETPTSRDKPLHVMKHLELTLIYLKRVSVWRFHSTQCDIWEHEQGVFKHTHLHTHSCSHSDNPTELYALEMCVTGIRVWVGYVAAMLNWIIAFFKTLPAHSQLKPLAHFNLWHITARMWVSTGSTVSLQLVSLTFWLDTPAMVSIGSCGMWLSIR